MKRPASLRRAMPVLSWVMATAVTLPVAAQVTPEFTPMTPDVVSSYEQVRPEADFIRRVAMIPMRDGVKLYTVIVMKKGTAPRAN
jgi:uncharacterized protein